MEKIGLVLEGGGMKGVYTAGVLEYFMEKDIYFPYVIGVSAGAGAGASYLARQKGRNKKVNIEFIKDPRFLSWGNFYRRKELFGMDFIFDEIPNKLVPFDFGSFLNGEEKFVVGTTDSVTGEAVYYNKEEDGEEMLRIIRASSSLPLVAPTVYYKNRMLLDGGIADPIPIKKAEEDGFKKNVVIMTKPKGFFRKPSKFPRIFRMFYRRYPAIGSILSERWKTYNDTLAYIAKEQKSGMAFVIQPSIDIGISRMERNKDKLLRLYELGYKDAERMEEELKKFLNLSEKLQG